MNDSIALKYGFQIGERQMTDTRYAAILAAVKTINTEYFGDFSLSSKELDAVAVLVAAALEITTAHAAGKAEGLRDAAVIAQGRWQTWTSGCEVSCDVTACENIATAILALIPAATGCNE
jgi:hypothetical protein